MASRAQTSVSSRDGRFDYEPMFFSHPTSDDLWPTTFLNKQLNYPLWVSSMTGGTAHAEFINQNLAKLCGVYKLGMGLGSCRALLTSDERLKEFQIRKYLGDQPFLANLGIAQLEELVVNGQTKKISELVEKLDADGIIIHINPLQEWFQPEGDRFKFSPLETLKRFLDQSSLNVYVKEVGQGMGPKSLKALLDLPIKGIEFGAFGGTNFSLLESMRAEEVASKTPFINVGHSALEMIEVLNALPTHNKEFIISGGIKNILDGYELKTKFKHEALIGIAHGFLNPAMESFESLDVYFSTMRDSLLTARGLLRVKGDQ
jgi:isopentenyl-diphosphate delta-isomerase